jgi:GTPase SAR1 family protein
MRVVMLGHTGVGKTTYMASLYGAMQQSVEGFSLRAVNLEDHNRWKNLADRIRREEYPVSTDQRQEYSFHLRYQGRNIVEFAWADYRGGTLRETQESDRAKALLEDLKSADGIMLFCDSSALEAGDRRSNQIGRMITLTTQALKNLERPISLAIVLTKTDLVVDFQVTLLDSLSGLITAVNVSSNVVGAIIPIACGKELCNISMPLLFVLHTSVLWQAVLASATAETHQGLAKSYEARSRGFVGTVDWIISKVRDRPTFREMAAKERSEAAAKLREFDVIRDPAESLYYYVQKLPLIKTDLTLTNYVELLTQSRGGVLNHKLKPQDPFSMFDE